ncbi:MAG TPA: DUF202 domain-containing protein [Pirellulaceae bacterium]|nr:DUF202 domain-containing protein [Pirellulaceae bacterium]
MILFYGTQFYGKVDKVPMLGHVATSFFYIQFVPLIPLGSYLVLEDGQGSLSVGFSFKSLLVAWLRTALVFGAVGLAIAGILATGNRSTLGMAASFGGAVACIAAMIGSYFVPFVGQASFERAMRLADQVGVKPEFRLTLEVHYGRKTAQQADAELAALYDAAQKEFAARQEEYQRQDAQRQAQMVNPFAQGPA